MWSETVGQRLGQDWSRSKKSVLVLVLVLQVWCYVVKYGLATFVVIMILKNSAAFQVLFIVSRRCDSLRLLATIIQIQIQIFYAWNITTVEINSGVF